MATAALSFHAYQRARVFGLIIFISICHRGITDRDQQLALYINLYMKLYESYIESPMGVCMHATPIDDD